MNDTNFILLGLTACFCLGCAALLFIGVQICHSLQHIGTKLDRLNNRSDLGEAVGDLASLSILARPLPATPKS
jgi:hypothetical protein